MQICPKCKVTYMDGESHACGQDRHWRTTGATGHSKAPSATNSAEALAALSGRYRDGYRQGRFINSVGQFLKIAGAALGVVIAIGGVAGSGEAGSFSTSLAVGSVIIGAVVGLTFFVFGVAISAQGQLVMAALDTAVHSSPFLTDEQRAQIMF